MFWYDVFWRVAILSVLICCAQNIVRSHWMIMLQNICPRCKLYIYQRGQGWSELVWQGQQKPLPKYWYSLTLIRRPTSTGYRLCLVSLQITDCSLFLAAVVVVVMTRRTGLLRYCLICLLWIVLPPGRYAYWGAGKSLALPGRKQAAPVKSAMGRGMDWFG